MRSGETSSRAEFTSGGLPPTVFRGGLTNCPLQPTGMVSPGFFTGIWLTHLSPWRLSGWAPGQGSTGAGAAETLELPAAAPLVFVALSGAVPNVTEMTAE